MFNARYWAPRYYAARYWPQIGAELNLRNITLFTTGLTGHWSTRGLAGHWETGGLR